MTDTEQLKKEIAELKAELQAYKDRDQRMKERNRKAGFFLFRWLTKFIVGPGLVQQFRRTWDAWIQWKGKGPWPSEETAYLGGRILARMTRVGAITIFVALLATAGPLFFLWQQNKLLDQQIKVAENQRKMVDQQNAFIAFDI